MLVSNPILPGFHPDPSICRVGDDYYIATSTFEWWPGIRLFHSRDLANWQPVGFALTRRNQLDMRGTPDSGGVWAPALSRADGKFWLCFSDVRALTGPFKDVRNYVITAESITGPWSDPIPLNSSGFDPSLFHDDDGRKWMLNQIWECRPTGNTFAGIALQEFDPVRGELVGESRKIFAGTELGCTEGPQVYKKDGYYYLFMAEGGTGFAHAESVVRSKSIMGPYEISPYHPLVSARDYPDASLQKTGHGGIVPGPDGRWYLTHLCSRPIGEEMRCILGRESAIQAVEWPEGEWPRLAGNQGPRPADAVEMPWASPANDTDEGVFRDGFDETSLANEWQTLREPADSSWLEHSPADGKVRLKGRFSLQCTFNQSLIAVRLNAHHTKVKVNIDYEPGHYQQTAGLVFYYNTKCFHYLQVGWEENLGRVVRIISADTVEYFTPLDRPVPVTDTGTLTLAAELKNGRLLFSWADESGEFQNVGPSLDATVLSDDHVIASGEWGFTGCMVGLCAQDATDSAPWAEFSAFERRSLNPVHEAAATRAV